MQPEGEEEKCQGIAVSLTSLLENFGFTGVDQLPDVDQIKNHINNHGIGKTKKINQVFNVNVKMTATMCPLHTRPASWFKKKKSAFALDAWQDFATYKYKFYFHFSI